MIIRHADIHPGKTVAAVPAHQLETFAIRLTRLLSSCIYQASEGRLRGPVKHQYIDNKWVRWAVQSRANYEWLLALLEQTFSLYFIETSDEHLYVSHLNTLKGFKLWFKAGQLTPFPEE